MKKPLEFALLRGLAAAGVIALIVLGFSMQKEISSSASFGDVLNAVKTAAVLEETQQGDNIMLRRLYGLDPTQFEEYALYYPSSNMGAREMLLVKLKDPSDRNLLADAAKARVEAQINVFEGYAAEQTALLKNHAVIAAPGNYFLFIVDENAAAAAAAFNEVL